MKTTEPDSLPPNSLTPTDSHTASDSPDSAGASSTEPQEIMCAAWEQVMGVLQTELSAPAYNNYLRHIQPRELQRDRMVLAAPSDFVKDWLVRRFGKRIEETLEQFLGRPIALAYQIASTDIASAQYSDSQDESTPQAADGHIGVTEPERLQAQED